MTIVRASPRDFPQVWERPSFEDLLACLKHLHAEPPIWFSLASKKTEAEKQEITAQYRREVVAYLSSIVGSGLGWIKDDDEKEIIWDEASRCLSQRCGRAAMGEITRGWPFENREHPFELIVREPPIIGDSLGHKTWGSSYLMAQQLDDVASRRLLHLLGENLPDDLRVLELGSGTGLLGIAAAAMWQTEVVLSDLPEIMPNLNYNIEQNRARVEQLGGKLDSGTLIWGSSDGNDPKFSPGNQFDIILAADSLYDDNHPGLLASAIHQQLADSNESRAIVMSPLRDEVTKRLIKKFKAEMRAGPLPMVIIEQRTITGRDDWGDEDEPQTVECWWAIFARSSMRYDEWKIDE
ncbi:putative methyltransferase-domain-containing protein [Poronia punctata]|nr:putative methyltransferase-domain-containing protein [Poronia punctata]